ncbi:hypothetical protein [Kander virus]|uniref:C3H1-type domain-containing protein n=1 Tax=Kander virus TaxID=2883639 RepID=A0ABY3P9I5_9MONO|nr:hypothetical protein QKS96_gp5 [Kander virus]UCU83240.1 hypothetical protein [Kander virus]
MASRSGHRPFQSGRMPGFRAKGRVCYGFLSGTCKLGEHCRFQHDIKYGTERDQYIFSRMKIDQLLSINARPTRGAPNDEIAVKFNFERMLAGNNGLIPMGGPANDRCTLMACEKVYAGISDPSLLEKWMPEGPDAIHALQFLGPQQRTDWRVGHLRQIPEVTNRRLAALVLRGLTHLEESASTAEGSLWGPKHEPSSRMCRYYKQGYCFRASSCRYSHNPFKLSAGDLIRGIASGLQSLDLAAAGQSVMDATKTPSLAAANPSECLNRLLKTNASGGRLGTQDFLDMGLLVWMWQYVPPSEDGPTPAAEGDLSGKLRSTLLALKSLEGPKEVARSLSQFSQEVRSRLLIAMKKSGSW